MFTGIVEGIAEVVEANREGGNLQLRLKGRLDDEPIKVDQSIAHNGACLTVTEIFQNTVEKEYSVTAVEETLKKTNLGRLEAGDLVNLERCLGAGQRLDGHFVQGHVDTVGKVSSVEELDGSWLIWFSYDPSFSHLMVDKGSITINGVSLTVIEAGEGRFNVTIIPYTWEHTQFHRLKAGDEVNLEFDILGKYLTKMYKK